jgi:Ca-activated chloride channel homolog
MSHHSSAARSLCLIALCLAAACGEDSALDSEGARPTGSNNNNNNYYDMSPPPQSYSDMSSGAPQEPPVEEPNDNGFDPIIENDFIETSTEPTSTFSVDVDNASYTLARGVLNNGELPTPTSVRVEDFINYFHYSYPEPMREHPFSISLEVAPSPFGEGKHLMRVGLQGKHIARAEMKPTSLVFLVDVSGSMQGYKLDLIKRALNTLVDNMRASDKIGIVVYAGADGVVLPISDVRDKPGIKAAINALGSGGGTNAEAGIVTAYDMLEQAKQEDGNNRVIILTDGDFNVGRTGQALVDLIASYRDKELSLTCVGVGLGNYNDLQMEYLAHQGNGNYFYLDTEEEAQRIFGEELPSTLEVIAADVKIQVEMNADAVARYRLVGYDNRILANEDFRDDTKDAGEIGPGHDVTALYEIELRPEAPGEAVLSQVRLRYKSQYGDASVEFSQPIKMSQVRQDISAASADLRFVAAVAEFAEILRGSKHSEGDRFDEVRDMARAASQPLNNERSELLRLIEIARDLKN